MYGLPFVLVMLNFSLTVLYLDYKQENGDSEGMNICTILQIRVNTKVIHLRYLFAIGKQSEWLVVFV